MTEEKITLAIIEWLKKNKHEIIAFDFPQSGTGICIHPDDRSDKTLKTFIPDIIALKNKKLYFFENKGFYCQQDFEKIKKIRETSYYSNDYGKIINRYNAKECYFGIGGPDTKEFQNKALANCESTDFIVSVSGKNVKIMFGHKII